MLAAAVTDIVVRDQDPWVALRLGDHPLDESAVALLGVRAAAQLVLGLADAHEQRIADALQLGRAEKAGAADGADLPIDPLARKSGGPELGELQLEPGYLAPELDPERALIIDRYRGAWKDRLSVLLECCWHPRIPLLACRLF